MAARRRRKTQRLVIAVLAAGICIGAVLALPAEAPENVTAKKAADETALPLSIPEQAPELLEAPLAAVAADTEGVVYLGHLGLVVHGDSLHRTGALAGPTQRAPPRFGPGSAVEMPQDTLQRRVEKTEAADADTTVASRQDEALHP